MLTPDDPKQSNMLLSKYIKKILSYFFLLNHVLRVVRFTFGQVKSTKLHQINPHTIKKTSIKKIAVYEHSFIL